MAGNQLETMVHAQMTNTLNQQLDSSVQAGNIQAARQAARQLEQLAVAQAKNTPTQFTNADIRAVLKEKAPWFGVDPRRSARAVEFGKNMEPQSFKSAEEFAEKLIEAVDEEFEPKDEDDEPEEKKVTRKRTDAPSDTPRAVPRRSSGPWAKLSEAPKEIAEQIKASADKFCRNATDDQRKKYISTALATAYASDQRRGKKP